MIYCVGIIIVLFAKKKHCCDTLRDSLQINDRHQHLHKRTITQIGKIDRSLSLYLFPSLSDQKEIHIEKQTTLKAAHLVTYNIFQYAISSRILLRTRTLARSNNTFNEKSHNQIEEQNQKVNAWFDRQKKRTNAGKTNRHIFCEIKLQSTLRYCRYPQ